jgi:Glyoxalase-like domain
MGEPIDRQLPERDEVFLDHVGFFVPDLEIAGERLRRLGFPVSPINLQQNADAEGVLRPSGTSNRFSIMRLGFLEVLAATHDTPLGAQLKSALERYEGLHLIAFSHADVAAKRERLVAAGFPMQQVARLRRHRDMPEGRREVAWSVLRPEPGVMAEGRVQFAYCHTPELHWTPGTPEPENGADSLSDLLIIVADAREAATRLGRYVERAPVHENARSLVTLDRSRLVLVEPAAAARILPGWAPAEVPFIAGQGIVADLSKAQAALARGGVTPLHADDDLICVGPADALGGYLLFHRAGLVDPWDVLAARGASGVGV